MFHLNVLPVLSRDVFSRKYIIDRKKRFLPFFFSSGKTKNKRKKMSKSEFQQNNAWARKFRELNSHINNQNRYYNNIKGFEHKNFILFEIFENMDF